MPAVPDYLSSLNDQQRAAVLHASGPAMVLAGAGSGKTRVLTTRVAWLIQEQLIDPSEILLVTFTNKAAQEMGQRVQSLTGAKLPFSGTFHRISANILRRDGYHVGLKPGFSIYDADDQLSLIKQIYKSQGYSTKEHNPNAVKATISKAKNEMLTWQEYEQLASGQFQEFTARIYKLYQLALKEQQAVDFDDLLLKVVELLQSQKTVLDRYQTQLTHVLVDEYQDTNKVQYQLTKLFARPQNNVYIVGDFAQSIYAWRGADYRNLLNLKQDFNDIAEYRLEQNYRSTQTILDAATAVISKGNDFPILQLWTENTNREPIVLLESETGDDEARTVVDEVRQLHKTYSYSDMAVLYRTNAQSRPFEEALVRAGIPYRLVGGFKFYERKEIKDLLAYLRLVVNPQDTVSHERVLKLGKRRLEAFLLWRDTLGEDATTATAPLELLQHILKATNYLDQFDKEDPEDFARIENIQELQNVASQFTDSRVFLENVALVQDDYLADVEKADQRDTLTLMSLHSAKGLEFPVVFVVGMEDGILPHSRSLLDKAQMEEERRLTYVGITRAKEKLYLSYARVRWIFGTPTYGLRSRFLRDIPESLVEQRSSGGDAYVQNSFATSQAYTGQRSAWRKPATPKGRHLVIDDDMLDAVLTGEMDIKKFLEE